MAVAIRFLALTRVVLLVLILTECNTQKFEGIDANFFVWHIFQGMVLIVQTIGYVASMSLFKATIHKTKHSKA